MSAAQFEAVPAMPTPEAVELEQRGVRYQLAIVQGSVQVTYCGVQERAASVRVLVEAAADPELSDEKARWAAESGAEWSLSSTNGTLALTAIARDANAAPSDIVLRFEGARTLSLDALGNLLIVTEAGDLHQQRPAVFNASAAPVPSRYVLLGGNRVAVEVWTQRTNVANGVDTVWAP